ncbi:MAG: hypothetical protein AAGA78_18030 [Pseudomonadota bacterium]
MKALRLVLALGSLCLAPVAGSAEELERFKRLALGACLGALETVRAPIPGDGLEAGTDPTGLLDWCSYKVAPEHHVEVTDYFDLWASQMVSIARYVPLPGGPRILESFEWREPVIQVSLLVSDGVLTFRAEEIYKES